MLGQQCGIADKVGICCVCAGGFSASEVHAWLGGVLPGIPQHLPSSSSSNSSNYLLFKQQDTGTLLGCIYGQGQATFMW